MKPGIAIVVGMLLLGCSPVLRADTAAEELLRRCVAAEARAATLKADFTWNLAANAEEGEPGSAHHGAILLKKPNLCDIAYTVQETGQKIVIHSDGKLLYRYWPAENAYERKYIDMGGGNVGNLRAKIFFFPDTLNQFRSQGSGARIAGGLDVGGIRCRILEVTGTPQGVSYRFYIGPDGILRGMKFDMDTPVGRSAEEQKLTGLRVNEAVPLSRFRWSLPHGATPYQEPAEKPRPHYNIDDAMVMSAGARICQMVGKGNVSRGRRK